MELWPMLNIGLEKTLLFCNARIYRRITSIVGFGIMVIIAPLSLNKSTSVKTDSIFRNLQNGWQIPDLAC